MKTFTAISLLLSLTLSQFAQADCYEKFEESVKKPLVNWTMSRSSKASDISPVELAAGSGLGMLIGAGFIGASATPLLIIPAAVIGSAAAIDGVIALTNIKEKKMMRLISEADDYIQSGGSMSPGRVLVRIKNKIKAETDLYTLARHISKANKNGNLCRGKLPSLTRIAKDINKAVIVIDGSDV